MTRPRGRVLAPLLLTAATLLALLGPATPGLAAPAPAAAPVATTATTATTADTAVLALGGISPPVAGPGVTVTVTGSVVARTTRLENPTVRVVLGVTAVGSRAAVEAWAAGTSPPGGLEVGSVTLGRAVEVGTSAPFTLTIAPGRLGLNRAFGTIPVGIQVRDTASSTSEYTHTFIGWQRTKQYEPLRIAVVAPVTLSPDADLFSTDQGTRTAAWQRELAPGSRLNRILDGTDVDGPAGPVPVTWAVDPAVLAPGSAQLPQVAPAPGTDPLVPVVAPLVTRLATGAGRHTLWALPQADPDLAATLAADPRDPTVSAEITAAGSLSRQLGVSAQTGVAWPVDGSFEAGRLAALGQAYPAGALQAVLGSSSALPTTSGFSGQAPRRTASGLTLLAWDDVLSTLATRTTTPAEGALTTQRAVAETAAVLGESPGVARTFLVALPRTVDPDVGALRQLLGGLAQTPWVEMVTTDEVRQQAATQDPVASTSSGSWQGYGDPQVDAAGLTAITEQRRTTGEVASVLGAAGEAYKDRIWTLLDQLPSARWRTGAAERGRLDAMVRQSSAAATSGISVQAQTTNFLADEGTLQVTVVNDLGVAVDGVRLRLQPTNPRLRIVEEPPPVQIAAGSKAVVPVRAEALAAGLVPVDATLTTEDGTPIGTPGLITVRANPPGYAFYIVGGAVVGLILVLGVVRTLRRSRRAARAAREAASAAPPTVPDPAQPVAVPDDPAVASASPPPGGDGPPRRMTDERT